MSVVTVTIPSVPPDATGHWRKVVTGIDPTQRGGYAVLGHFVQPEERLTVPLGTLVLAVDKNVFERTGGPRLGAGRFIESATVRILKARTRGLVEVWSRDYRSAWIHPSVLNRLTTLLRKHQERLARNPERAEQDRAAAREANARRAERARLARARAGGRSSGVAATPRARATSGRSQNSARMRAWAKANGYKVNDRGPVPASLREAYEKANS